MTTFDTKTVAGFRGRTVKDNSGDKIGKVEEIYLDDESGQPEWLAIKTGLFGSRASFAPLQGAEQQGDDIVLPFSKDKVKGAPNVEDDGRLEPAEEAELYRYYGQGQAADTASSEGHDVSGPNTDAAMTRSEEELRVGKISQEAGRVRLRKWVETEHASTTVPVQHEEVRIEREPVTAANLDRAMDGPAISEEEHEIVLTEEHAVASKEAVPQERVRLTKETVTGEEEVGADLRKERIETEGMDQANR